MHNFTHCLSHLSYLFNFRVVSVETPDQSEHSKLNGCYLLWFFRDSNVISQRLNMIVCSAQPYNNEIVLFFWHDYNYFKIHHVNVVCIEFVCSATAFGDKCIDSESQETYFEIIFRVFYQLYCASMFFLCILTGFMFSYTASTCLSCRCEMIIEISNVIC